MIDYLLTLAIVGFLSGLMVLWTRFMWFVLMEMVKSHGLEKVVHGAFFLIYLSLSVIGTIIISHQGVGCA